MTITLKVSDNTKLEMNEFFNDYKREKTPPYAVFQADDGDTVLTLYESGKAVFQGKDADLSSSFWIEREKFLNPNKKLEVTNSEEKKKEDKIEDKVDPRINNSNTIGSDEVGTGDYFGPIVVTAAYVTTEDKSFLEELKVGDSKRFNDEQILEIVPKLIKRIKYKSIVLSNTDYNKNHSSEMNMNKIKALLHNKVLIEATNEFPAEFVVIDQFTPLYSYLNYLKDSPKPKKFLTFMTKAEDKVLAVACASLISRYIFIKEFDKLNDSIGIFLPKGASDAVDDAGVKVVQKYGEDKLKEIAKLNFKNTDKIKNKLEN